MATVTNSCRRGERSSGSTKVAASKPKLRQTSVANRGAQSGTPKPGTYSSNNTMAKKPSPTNKRGGAQRKTGGQAGGRAGRPAGNIARPSAKPAAAKAPAAKPPQKALPAAGQSGGSQSPKGTTTPRRGGPVRTPAQRAMERRAAAASKQAAANLGKRASNTAPKTGQGVVKAGGNFRAPGLPKGVTNAVKGATKVATNVAKSGAGKTAAKVGKNIGKGLLAKAAVPVDIALTANSIFNPKSEGNQQLGKAIAAVNKRYSSNYGPRFKKSGVSKSFNEKAYASQQKFTVPKPKKPAAPKAPAAPARSSAPSRSSATVRTPASRPAAKPAAKPKVPASMATESSMSASDVMKGYGMRVNQTFGAESPSTPKKRESLKDQTASIKKMIEESKKRQGK